MHRSLLPPGAALFLAVAAIWPALAAETPAPANNPGNSPASGFSAALPSGGRHETEMTVSRWGRYSLQATGEQPVALSVADKRNGIMHRDGDPGQRNGRIDLFLDIGPYKLAVQGAKKATGTSTVSAIPFTYPAGFKPAWLLPLRENRFSLNDLEQASFWFELPADTTVYIEAVGRNLAELALWRDGEWLVPTDNRPFVAKPKDETPLTGFTFSARLPKGAYMVGLYGGKGRSWSLKSEEHPCYLQMGIASLGANLRSAQSVPPKGYAEVLLAPNVTNVLVEGADKQHLGAEITRLGQDYSAGGWLASDSIHGKSAGPRMLLFPAGVTASEGWRMLKVFGAPGRPYTLQTFGPCACGLGGKEPSAWWIASQHSGNPQDQLGASGLIVDHKDGALVAVSADTVGEKEIAHRFNLLAGMNAFIWVGESGKYTFTPGGTQYHWSLGRFWHYPPPNAAIPGTYEGSRTLELNQGLHLLTLEPINKGIANFVLRKSSLLGGMIAAGKAAVGADDKRNWDAPRSEMRFPRIAMGKDAYYDVRVNSQSPEIDGVSARKLPLDPDDPVSFWLKPGEKLEIPLKLSGRRLLSVTDIRGATVPFELAGKRTEAALEAAGGNQTVTLSGTGNGERLVVLSALDPERNPNGPAPEFPDSRREALPKFPALAAGKTAFLDLDRGGNQPFAVSVAEPGLYRIETTGRLATSLQIADRFRHFTRSAAANGVGRNALLIEYLLPGQYQVTVTANAPSAGRLGLAVYRNALAEGGSLEAGIDNRKFIESFSGAGYDVRIANAGKYRLESLGQNGNHSLRLEDKDGWPVEPAVTEGARTLTLAKGGYRLISLPRPQEGRRIARLSAIADKRAIKGKGPHPLALNATLASTWMDDGSRAAAGDSVGAPSVFTFSLPAPINAKLSVSNGFQGKLYRAGTDTAVVVWTGNRKAPLPMGEYRLLVAPEKKRNLAPYQVSVGTRDLVPGLAYDLSRKETFAVSLGEASIVELGSQGMLDVTATLLDADGKTVIASNDDGFLDWNFSISRALKAGRYFLRAESAEARFTSTTVFMRALSDTLVDTLQSTGGKAKSVACRLNRRLGVFPLSAGAGDILACAAQGKSRIGLSLEKAGVLPGQWIQVAQAGGENPSLSVPRSPGTKYRLKAWSESIADDEITVAYLAATANRADEKEAARGLSGQPEALGADQRAWFKVDLGSHAPGQFRTISDQNPLASIAASIALDSAFETEEDAGFASPARQAWVELRFEQAGKFRVKLEPVILENGKPQAFALAGGRPRVLESKQAEGSIGLLSVETDGAWPLAGALVAEGGSDKAPRFQVRGLDVKQAVWIGPGRTATVALPGDQRRVAVWNALPPLDGTRPTAKLSWTELPVVDLETLSPGAVDWHPKKPQAGKARLPAGSARLRVTLAPQGAAVLRRGDGSMTLECNFTEEPMVREFQADGGELYVLMPAAGATFGVALFASREYKDQGADAPLSAKGGKQINLAREGMTLLPVAADKSLGLYYRGAARGADWIGRDGRLHPDLANGTPVGPGGLLALRHGAGWAKLDLCDAKTAAEVMACKWGQSLSPSGSVEIGASSVTTLHERANWIVFTLPTATPHANFSAPLPLAALLLKDGVPYRYQEAWERFNWDLPLPPGKYALGIRPFAGAALEGAALASLFRPIETLSEKKPFTAYMGAGESRLLRFDVARKAEFGIGLRMGKETVEARLYDSAGRVAAQGKQQFATLAPGVYHLWLRVPEGAEGTEVTANLFGQEAPPNEPPERLVKWIITGGEGERPSVETEQAADPDEQKPQWERFLKRDEYGRTPEEAEAAAAAAANASAGEGEGEGEGAYHEDGESGEGDGNGNGDMGANQGESNGEAEGE